MQSAAASRFKYHFNERMVNAGDNDHNTTPAGRPLCVYYKFCECWVIVGSFGTLNRQCDCIFSFFVHHHSHTERTHSHTHIDVRN